MRDNDTARTQPVPAFDDAASQRSSSSVDGASHIHVTLGDQFEVLRPAGSGGMGSVFCCRDRSLNRLVAVKVQHVSADDGRARSRVRDEARAMARLRRHPNICGIYSVELDATPPLIVMEWIEGVSMDSAWEGLNVERRVEMLRRLLDALQAIHRAGLIHADIKPSNVLVDETGSPVVVDFGLTSPKGFRADACRGSPGFSAPEQFGPGSEIDERADIFSVGALLYLALTDRPPFVGDNVAQIIAASRLGDCPLPNELVPNVDPAVQRIVLKSLEVDPAERYPRAADFAADLDRWLRGETVTARPKRLESRFDEQVDGVLARIDAWRSLDLVTEREASELQRQLGKLRTPDEAWLIDARTIKPTQVLLACGAIILATSASVGLWASWTELSPPLRVAAPATVGVGIGAFGWMLLEKRRRQVGLGFLLTAVIISPAIAFALFRETEWLAGQSRLGMGQRELIFYVLGVEPGTPDEVPDVAAGFFNRQLAMIFVIWTGVAAAARALARSASITLVGSIAFGLLGCSLWLILGMLEDGSRLTAGSFGLWAAGIGATMLVFGICVSNWERRPEHVAGSDGPPILGVSVVLLVAGISLAASTLGDRYPIVRYFVPSDELTDNAIAGAFIVNGVLLQLVSIVLRRRPSVARRRLAESLRWLVPSHLLGALIALHINAEREQVVVLWLCLLVAASLGVAGASVPRQWRPFLYSGVAYLGVAYALLFRASNQFQWQIDRLAAATGAAVGVLFLVAALVESSRRTRV
jgi:serine/threonine protein kinase